MQINLSSHQSKLTITTNVFSSCQDLNIIQMIDINLQKTLQAIQPFDFILEYITCPCHVIQGNSKYMVVICMFSSKHLRYCYKEVIKNSVQQIIVMIHIQFASNGLAYKGTHMTLTYHQSVSKYSIILIPISPYIFCIMRFDSI
jgi:hypothetical protein